MLTKSNCCGEVAWTIRIFVGSALQSRLLRCSVTLSTVLTAGSCDPGPDCPEGPAPVTLTEGRALLRFEGQSAWVYSTYCVVRVTIGDTPFGRFEVFGSGAAPDGYEGCVVDPAIAVAEYELDAPFVAEAYCLDSLGLW